MAKEAVMKQLDEMRDVFLALDEALIVSANATVDPLTREDREAIYNIMCRLSRDYYNEHKALSLNDEVIA